MHTHTLVRARLHTLTHFPHTHSHTSAASRGKRKLDFNEHRFRGKLMFLDLAGYRRAAEIERELEDRGAVREGGEGERGGGRWGQL